MTAEKAAKMAESRIVMRNGPAYFKSFPIVFDV